MSERDFNKFLSPAVVCKAKPKSPDYDKAPNNIIWIFLSHHDIAQMNKKWKQSEKPQESKTHSDCPLGRALVFTFLLTPTQCLSIIVLHSTLPFLLRPAFREALREEKTSNKHRSKWVKHKNKAKETRELTCSITYFISLGSFTSFLSRLASVQNCFPSRDVGQWRDRTFRAHFTGESSLTFSPNRCCLQIDNSFLSLFIVHLSSTGLTFSFFFLVHVYQ